jgi:hypothetical protein
LWLYGDLPQFASRVISEVEQNTLSVISYFKTSIADLLVRSNGNSICPQFSIQNDIANPLSLSSAFEFNENYGSLHEFSEILGFPKVWEPNSSFWEPNPKFWDSRINLFFVISEVDAELPFTLRKISFKRVGVHSGVA